jgi:ABC-type thiamine transport system ATPase subunit
VVFEFEGFASFPFFLEGLLKSSYGLALTYDSPVHLIDELLCLLFAFLYLEDIQIQFIVGQIIADDRRGAVVLLVLHKLSDSDRVVGRVVVFGVGGVAFANHLNLFVNIKFIKVKIVKR